MLESYHNYFSTHIIDNLLIIILLNIIILNTCIDSPYSYPVFILIFSGIENIYDDRVK